MHVLIGTNTLTQGSGIDRVVVMQATQLAEQGHQVRIMCFEHDSSISGPFQIISFPHAQNVTIERIRRLYPFFHPSTRRHIQQQINWADVVYAEQYPWSVVGVWAKKKGKRFIQINHGVADPRHFRLWAHQVYVKWINALAVRYGRQADEVWSVSQALADEWKKFTGQTSQVFRPQEEWLKHIPERTPEQARHSLKQITPYLLFVGRISPHKGIHLLLDIMQRVWAVRPDVELKLVGKVADEGYAQELKRTAGDKVTFLGTVSDQDLGLLYQGCAAYMTAAEWEGWNLPIREALFFKRPVVCVDLPVHREFKHELVHLIPQGNLDTFAQTCLKLI